MLDFRLRLIFSGPFPPLRISSKSSIRNYMFDFNVLKFFDINTRSDKVLHPLPIR